MLKASLAVYIWLLWTEEVEVIRPNSNVILANVSYDQPNIRFRLVFVYGDPYPFHTYDIWSLSCFC
jgi:hypothetical protein